MPYYPSRGSKKKYRKVYTVRICVFVCVLSLLSAGVLFWFSLTPGSLILSNYCLYFTGSADFETLSEAKGANAVAVADCFESGASILDEEFSQKQYFAIENVYLTKAEADESVLKDAENGERKAVLMLQTGQMQISAHKDEAVNGKIITYKNSGEQIAASLIKLLRETESKQTTQKLSVQTIDKIHNKILALKKEILYSPADCSAVFASSYTSLECNAEKIKRSIINGNTDSVKTAVVSSVYDFYLYSSLINGFKIIV